MDLRAQSAGHKLSLGIALITIAFLCSAVMSAFSKAASGAPPLMILFLQYATSFLVFVPAAVASGPETLKDATFLVALVPKPVGIGLPAAFFRCGGIDSAA